LDLRVFFCDFLLGYLVVIYREVSDTDVERRDNKMKKWIFAVLLVLVLTGCGAGEQDKNSEAMTLPVENTEDEKIAVSVEVMEEEFLDLGTYSTKNMESTDGQPEFSWTRGASSDLGLYYWESSGGRLMYYDKASKQQVPLCNRPNCKHTDDACNAAFYTYTIGSIEFYKNMIFYYGDSVYIIGDDSSGYVNVYKVAYDGSSWEKYMPLFKAEKTITVENDMTKVEWRQPDVFLHKEYVYYVDNSESQPKLRRILMGGSEIEVVAEAQGERAMLYRVKCYGDFVFFQSAHYIGEEIFGGIYAYNVKNGEVVLVKVDAIRDYYIVDDMLYFEMEETIYQYDLKTGIQKELPVKCMKDTWNSYYVDEDAIYVFSGGLGCLDIYDKEGKHLTSVIDSRIRDCFFGKNGYFLADTEEDGIAVLDVDSARKGNGEWICSPKED